ncbi:ABC transporter permease [Reichenbachiella sp.]|uniref:ABC transporter permease n=1 Tax=Reichenbachiella sp. TaxID=2184521 RepID=UPI00329A3FF8
MIKNFIKVAFRNLVRNKLYTTINVLGLALGIAACQMVLNYVLHETSYDNWHSKKDRIYRLIQEIDRPDDFLKYAKVPHPVKPLLLQEFPEIEQVTRIYPSAIIGGKIKMKYQEQQYYEEDIFMVDPNFFEVFDFEFLEGNEATALIHPNSLVLTEKSARKYFGSTSPLGKTIDYNGQTNLEITGVIKHVPENSHMQFDFLIPMEYQRDTWVRNFNYDFEEDWMWSGAAVYLQLKSGVNHNQLTGKLPTFVDTHFRGEKQERTTLDLQPLTDIHLDSDMKGEIGISGSKSQLYVFTIIAMLILMVAAINFMNLATAKSVKRAREVGIRKVMGARRTQLIYQFIGEALVIALIAMLHAYLIANLAWPVFNHFTDKNLSFMAFMTNPMILTGSFGITFLTGILAGVYPAFFLSAFQPVRTLKNDFKGNGSLSLRKILVLFQFVISIVFILAILVVGNQLDYLRNKDLGFNKEAIITINDQGNAGKNFNVLKQRLLTNRKIKDVYRGQILGGTVWSNSVVPQGFHDDEAISVSMLYTGDNFTDLFEISVLEGRKFDKSIDIDNDNERCAFLINEAAKRRFGWTEDPIGREVQWIGGNDNKTLVKGKVVGVVEDFNYRSLYETIEPIIIIFSNWGHIAVKVDTENIQESIAFIRDEWELQAPGWDFDFSFLDKTLDAQYKKEENLSQVIRYFAGLAIFVSCLGVVGLVSFIVEQKRKEIAIRKTLGASVRHVLSLISSGFIKLVLVSSLIGCPIAYFLMQDWLENFAYRTELGLDIFVLAMIGNLLIVLITITSHTLHAATENPVKSLRQE